jgi:hypothetical protein
MCCFGVILNGLTWHSWKGLKGKQIPLDVKQWTKYYSLYIYHCIFSHNFHLQVTITNLINELFKVGQKLPWHWNKATNYVMCITHLRIGVVIAIVDECSLQHAHKRSWLNLI